MPASPESRMLMRKLMKEFQIIKEYVYMLEHLVPEHFNAYKKTLEYKKWKKVKTGMMQWATRRYL
jgi:hypothetical protein